MKTTMKILLPLLFIAVASLCHAAALPTLDVKISDAAGKVVYQGKTNASGTFATGNLQPGNYVVQFTAKNTSPKGKYALSVTAGKNEMSADAVAVERFADPGVAMKVAVPSATKITGGVNAGGKAVASTGAAGKANVKDDREVKMINGKPHVWVLPNTGSVSGGHWVEVGSKEDTGAQIKAPKSQPATTRSY